MRQGARVYADAGIRNLELEAVIDKALCKESNLVERFFNKIKLF